jgi:hypothetical protein
MCLQGLKCIKWGRKARYPIAVKVGERKRGPHEELFLVSAFIKCRSDLWDPWTGCLKLAKAELRLWASTWTFFIQ